MVTIEIDKSILVFANGSNKSYAATVYCLSTDVIRHPDGKISIPGVHDPYNGQRAYEMDDTGTDEHKYHAVYLYDADNKTWIEQ